MLGTGAASASRIVQIPGERKGKTFDVIGVAGALVLQGLYPEDAQVMVELAVFERGHICHGSSRGSGTGTTSVKDSDVDVGESSDGDGARSMKK